MSTEDEQLDKLNVLLKLFGTGSYVNRAPHDVEPNSMQLSYETGDGWGFIFDRCIRLPSIGPGAWTYDTDYYETIEQLTTAVHEEVWEKTEARAVPLEPEKDNLEPFMERIIKTLTK